MSTFEFRGNVRENFTRRITELPDLDASTSAVVVPFNPIKHIPSRSLPASLAIASFRGCELTRVQFLIDTPNLVALDLSGNQLGHEGGMDLAKYLGSSARKLQKLHISGCHVPLSALIHIVQAMETLPKLRDADLSRNVAVVSASDGNFLTSDANELHYHLENLFLRSQSLTIGNFSGMSLGDEGVAAILSGIARNFRSALVSLDLSANKATWQSASLLNKVLRCRDRKPVLETLNLASNRLGQNATVAAVQHLGEALMDRSHCVLKQLDLSRNKLTGDALVVIVSAALRSSLKKLRIFDNQVWSNQVARNLVPILNAASSSDCQLDFSLQTVDLQTVFVVRK